ncbi:hypothetical protein NLJ89_g509 [Agrocybe chaxingu]|uniref:Uncharacterized protein n=1 Tax=Agrocybe chaxingu TaxID=84603 RepID=A0A9W8TFZ3_9AGAR|nr:hypothetical protein NLJ89_g509 [Agrocybe chaxingu]
MITTFIAELFLTLRVYALSGKSKSVLVISALFMAWQWGIAIYAMSQSDKGTDNVAVLLSVPTFPLPRLPEVDPYHGASSSFPLVCIFISVLGIAKWVEAWLCLSLAFDGLVFLAIIFITVRSARQHGFVPMMRIIQRDGIVYFFVLFSSNLVWLMLLLHARPALKFLHNQPAMVVSTIMINRITLNLKKARDKRSAWGVQTFETLYSDGSTKYNSSAGSRSGGSHNKIGSYPSQDIELKAKRSMVTV